MRRRRHGRGTEAISCDAVCLAISAVLDGEPSDLPRTTVVAHMVGCQDCREFEDGARALQRRRSLRASRPAPEALKDLVAAEWAERAISLPLVAEPGRTTARRTMLHRAMSRQTAPRHGWHRTARWAGAVVPAAALVIVLPLGTLTAAEGKPTHAPTPCTQNLRWPGADAP